MTAVTRIMVLFGLFYFLAIQVDPVVAQSSTGSSPRKVRLLTVGSNDAGQLGSTLEDSHASIPVWATEVEKILLPSFDILEIDGGQYMNCLLRSDRTVWCWGGGDTHAQGPRPPGVAKQIQDLPPAKHLEMGSGYSHCATTMDDDMWCWDENRWIAQGPPPKKDRTPLQNQWQQYKRYLGMANSCGISEGAVRCWGEDYGGYDNPADITLGAKALDVRVGKKESCAILADNSVSCWENSAKPTAVSILKGDGPLRDLAAAWQIGCVVKHDNTVWCWKSLGWGKNDDYTTYPLLIEEGKPLDNVSKLVSQGNDGMCVLRKDQSAWCFNGRSPDKKPGGKGATRLKSPDGVCNLGYVSDIAVGAHTTMAVVRGSDEDFAKLEIECIPD